MTSFITTVKDATFPDGQTGPVYAYVDEEQTVGVAMTIKRAIEMQQEGVEYRVTETRPADYGVWYEPDFPAIGTAPAR